MITSSRYFLLYATLSETTLQSMAFYTNFIGINMIPHEWHRQWLWYERVKFLVRRESSTQVVAPGVEGVEGAEGFVKVAITQSVFILGT